MTLANFTQQLQSVHRRHAQIRDHHASFALRQIIQRGMAVGDTNHLVTRRLKGDQQGIA